MKSVIQEALQGILRSGIMYKLDPRSAGPVFGVFVILLLALALSLLFLAPDPEAPPLLFLLGIFCQFGP
ncbi:MAG: hypothetical protein R3C68_06825 [Myxococcota bacterium]